MGDGSDPWPAVQLDAIERVSTATCRVHGRGARPVVGHLEWQPGKVDPRGFAMDGMRERVAARLGEGRSEPLPTPKRRRVSLSRPIAAVRSNPQAKGQPVAYDDVETYEAGLVDEGLPAKTFLDGHFGTTTITATSAWQECLGYRGRKPDQPSASGKPDGGRRPRAPTRAPLRPSCRHSVGMYSTA